MPKRKEELPRALWIDYTCKECKLRFRFEMWSANVPNERKVSCPICKGKVLRRGKDGCRG